MKKKYYALIYIALTVIALWIIYYSQLVFGWGPELINLIIINIIIFIARKPLISFFSYFVKNRLYRAVFSITVNVIWGIFLFWLLLPLSGELFIAILSYLVVAISLNFRKVINNMASGALLFSSKKFEIGDLIETNNIQGIVKEINLNYTKIREFDGTDIIIPNQNVYDATLTKFTHGKYKIFEPLPKEEFPKKKYYKRYIKMINKILSSKVKTTIYVKKLELLGSINPENLKSILSEVFERYEPIFGMRPDYAVDTTRFDRVRIMLYVKSEKPDVVLNYMDAFLRDILFELYPEEIYQDWEVYQKKTRTLESKRKRDDT